MENKGDSTAEVHSGDKEPKISVKQEQVHDILFRREFGWQDIIYDLINTEQLDPWNINLVILTDKYLEKVQKFDEEDFFISSQVLLAAALLLRIKSEILLNKYIRSIDEILFGKKDEKKSVLERIELDEEIPELIPRSPIPRFRKVTLQELMESLNKAIITENRRIKKEIVSKNALREVGFSMPKSTINIKDRIREIYNKLFSHLGKNQEKVKVSFHELMAGNREEKIIAFSPLLHLENQKKIWLEQEKHFDEIYIWLGETYRKHNPDIFADLRAELEEEIKERDLEIGDSGINSELVNEESVPEELDKEQKKRMKEINTKFENPMGKSKEDEK